VSALREIFARFSIDLDTAPIDRGESRLDSMVGSLNTFGQAVAANFAYQYVREFVVAIQSAGDALDKLGLMTGISGAALQQWRYAANLSGVASNEFDNSILRLQNRMAQGGPGAAIFRRLGVEIRNADGSLRNASDVLTDLADPIAALGSDSERTGVLVGLLGETGARMGPLFLQGSEGIARVREEFESLGGGLSEAAIADSAALGDAWTRLDVVAMSLRSRLAVFLLPALQSMTDLLTRAARTTSVVEAGLGLVVVALARTAIASSAVWGPMAANALRALLPMILVGLAVEDVVTFFRGGDSVIGRVMDALGGDGTQVQVAQDLRDAWEGAALAFRDLQTMIAEGAQAIGLGETAEGSLTAGGEIRTNVRGLQRGANGAPTETIIPGSVGLPNEFGVSRLTAPSLVVTNNSTPAISIDARGMDPAAIQAIVQRALANAAAASNQETLDALAGGGVE
jgi:hypothetical protein